MDRIKNITKNIINVLCVILFIILALVIYAKLKITFSNNDIHANYFGYRLFEVASGSMEPTLQINDVLLVKVNDNDLKKDDIIAYQQDDSVITHRIVVVDNDNLIVKGDANNTVDSPITKSQVIGKVVKVYPKLGIWKRILTEPKILILIFITLLLFDAALSYNGKTKKDEDKIIDNKKEDIAIENKKENTKIEEPKETKLEINKVEDTTQNVKKDILKTARELALSNLDEMLLQQEDNQEDNLDVDYTIRLDLNEIQKNIDKSVK